MAILANIKDEEARFKDALLRVFEERAAELPENTLKLMKALWLEGLHHGHELRLTEEIINLIKVKGRFDSNTGIFELGDFNGPTHE